MTITRPEPPNSCRYDFVPHDHPHMQAAQAIAQAASQDPQHPTGCVLVLADRVIGQGANGSDYHTTHGCERKRHNIPSGAKYNLCEGCHTSNHAEQKAIRAAHAQGHDTTGAVAYLWGHWWCCTSCWAYMKKAGICTAFLSESVKDR